MSTNGSLMKIRSHFESDPRIWLASESSLDSGAVQIERIALQIEDYYHLEPRPFFQKRERLLLRVPNFGFSKGNQKSLKGKCISPQTSILSTPQVPVFLNPRLFGKQISGSI